MYNNPPTYKKAGIELLQEKEATVTGISVNYNKNGDYSELLTISMDISISGKMSTKKIEEFIDRITKED